MFGKGNLWPPGSKKPKGGGPTNDKRAPQSES